MASYQESLNGQDLITDSWINDFIPDSEMLIAAEEFFESFCSVQSPQIISDDTAYIPDGPQTISEESFSRMDGVHDDKILKPSNSGMFVKNKAYPDAPVGGFNNSAVLKENEPPPIIDLTTSGSQAKKQQSKRGKAPVKRKTFTAPVPSRARAKRSNGVLSSGDSNGIVRNSCIVDTPEPSTSARDSWRYENLTDPFISCPNAPKRKESCKKWYRRENQTAKTPHSSPQSLFSEILSQREAAISPITDIMKTQRSPEGGESTCMVNDKTDLCDINLVPDTSEAHIFKRRITFDTPDTNDDGRDQVGICQVQNASYHHVLLVRSCTCWDENTYNVLSSLARYNDKMMRVANYLRCFVRDSMFLAFNNPNEISVIKIHAAHDKYERLMTHVDEIEKEMMGKN
ncbi:uncharacterized protein LOC121400527 isoform X2 [Xenopus laevis]|uniref:Uncharacterized protein LOC121400527 isoform X2 n=1 Tax=Xenopus laevis TaxID=8355 RepID=A0A8J1MDB3_XENLA|nr:uncharacterized protein LOC121400527 isoform X2 [Xenopus laevis]